MKKISLFVFGLIVPAVLIAQVALNPQLPPSGLKVKPQLWNISVINSASASMPVRIEMTMTDASSNQRVLTGVTNSFLLPPGIKQLTAADLMPIIYNAVGADYNIDAAADGFLPIGLFNVCFSVAAQNSDAHIALAESCETIEIDPLSPPRLVSPPDSAYVDVARPVFTWIPPSPATLFNLLTYDWVLTEVQPFQSGEEAVQQNMPLLKQQDVNYTSLQYPESLPELDTGKLYAWGITAKNNFRPAAKSEVWTFRIKREVQKNFPVTESYAGLKRGEDASFIVCSGLLRYEYLNEVNDSVIHVNIYDITGSRHEPVNLGRKEFTVRMGHNYLQMDLQRNGRFNDSHVYLFELVNDRGERWYLKFEYRKQN